MTTTKPQVKIVNLETGEEVIRDPSVAEIAQMKTDKTQLLADNQAEADRATAKAALLARLGITADEAKILLG